MHAVLERASGPLTVQLIGDALAAEGRRLKTRTIQDALANLGGLVDSLAIDGRGTTQWLIVSRAEPAPPPAEPPPEDEAPWRQEALP